MYYIYESPFVIPDGKPYPHTLFSETLGINEFERDDVKAIRALIFKFATEHKFVHFRNGKLNIQDSGIDVGDWRWIINTMNMRSLVDINQYSLLMTALQANDENPVTLLIDLHARLGTFFDVRVLNTMVDRVMKSIQIIPWDLGENAEERRVEWSRIHKETPFIWIIILLQGLIRNELGNPL